MQGDKLGFWAIGEGEGGGAMSIEWFRGPVGRKEEDGAPDVRLRQEGNVAGKKAGRVIGISIFFPVQRNDTYYIFMRVHCTWGVLISCFSRSVR
jgi:hypothetical protein